MNDFELGVRLSRIEERLDEALKPGRLRGKNARLEKEVERLTDENKRLHQQLTHILGTDLWVMFWRYIEAEKALKAIAAMRQIFTNSRNGEFYRQHNAITRAEQYVELTGVPMDKRQALELARSAVRLQEQEIDTAAKAAG